MPALFNRNFQVIIADDAKEIIIPANPFIENIMSKFSLISVANSSQATDSFVELYNLNDSDLNFIAAKAKKIEILAGYGKSNSIIYTGQIDKVEISKKKQDKKTHISIVADIYNINNSNYKISYVGDKSIKEIVIAALSSINLPANGTDLLPSTMIKNYAFMGKTKLLLNKLLIPNDLNWFINQGVLQITKNGQAGEQFIPLISKDTGMIGSPTLTTDGINVDSLLNQHIIAGNEVQIKSNAETISRDGRKTDNLKQAYNGNYKVTNVNHHGDTIRGVFFTSFICKEINKNG